ncbi:PENTATRICOPEPTIDE REPEAT-CONTAINING PROTEIN [Salix purpurea]|uniref:PENTATRICOPEPTIDE REPEAT-CONTAINING PROTEIN n=1 Tax=Salix purpurea TaxID=77065 RepID=A0A9Q0VI94_SALPP|nr:PENTATRICOPEPTIDE REPEAT-CONTAINING PROTEIN [Salix purpurea]
MIGKLAHFHLTPWFLVTLLVRAPRLHFSVYRRIVKDGFLPDMFTFPAVLKSCAKLCGDCVCKIFGDASRVFDEMLVRDVVSWTCVISGYVRAGLFDEAVGLFLRMDVEPNAATFVSVLVACGRKGYLSVGKGIHGLSFKSAFGVGLEDMQSSGIEPDAIILTSVLSACARLGALDYGRWVHEHIERKAIKWDIQIGTAMVDMYAKCGCIEMSMQIFDGMPHKNVLTWNALLNGLAMHGHAYKVLEFFEEMVRVGMRPNEVTFLAILAACCHCGLVNEGRQYFNRMKSQHYNLPPRLEHYGCMVDLLCRARLLDEALELTKAMPMSPDVSDNGSSS